VTTDLLPEIYPDYTEVTIPTDIAPLNFAMTDDEVTTMDVTVKGVKGGELHTNGAFADFDIDEWHQLLEQNKGGKLTVSVNAEKGGQWTAYRDFSIYVSNYPLDEWGITYRRIPPSYQIYSKMGLYQRCLATFEEKAMLKNTQINGMCINCHTPNKTNPDKYVFHARGANGATIIHREGKDELLQAKNEFLGGSMVYPYWHPSGKYCAFSTNQTRQSFHVADQNRIEVYDLSSDIFVYNPETHEILGDSLIQTKDWSENSPVFSPDGKTLYFLTCKQQEYPMHYKDEKYNLCKIAFHPETGTYGDHVDTLFNAVAMGKSLTWPRPSYDGKYLLFTLSDYGYFSIWHQESEQWLLDLQTGEARPLDEINSPRADSYHNWNVNSHWIVFTSRRVDGLYSHLYFASVDEQGRFTKPFMLPQKNPKEYYERSFYSFNTPDFTKSKVSFDTRKAVSEVMSDQRIETRVR
jgi:dipeptidyl aminopeptidase/acylaminoacyl peptidase